MRIAPAPEADLAELRPLFGFLNRWNDTLATELEEAPRAFAAAHLGQAGWSPGKHG